MSTLATATTQTFKSLLEGCLTNRIGRVNSDGTVSATQGDKVIVAGALGNWMRTIWEQPAGKDWVWPWTVQTASNVTLTGNAIPLSTIDYGMWWSVWSADPRTDGSTAYFIPSTWGAGGIKPQDVTLGSYFVFYIPRTPEFTTTVVAVSTAYTADQIVYDDGRSGHSKGQCYRCVTAYTSASSDSALDTELADTTKWIVQTVHKEFQTTLELGAFSQWLQSKREFAEAKAMEEAAYDELSDRFDNIYSTMNNYLPPAVWASGSWWR